MSKNSTNGIAEQSLAPDAVHAIVTGTVDWNELRPLEERGEATPYPLDAFPSIFAKAAEKIHAVTKADKAICGNAVLAATTLSVQPHGNVLIDGRCYPVSNYFVTVARSGDRKSEADRQAQKPITEYRRQLEEKFREEQKNDGADPLEPTLVTGDPTYEGLCRQLERGQPSLGIFCDEGGLFVGGHAMNKDNIVKTASGLSKAWDGDAITRTRKGDSGDKRSASTTLYGRRLAMHLSIQPEIAKDFLNHPHLRSQGLLWRMLICSPPARGVSPYEEEDISADPDMLLYCKRIKDILEAPLSIADGTRNELTPPNLLLTEEAKRLWIAFYNEMEQERVTGRFAEIDGFTAKAAEHALRIAGVFTLSEGLESQNIKEDAIDRAVRLMRYYLEERLRMEGVTASRDKRNAALLLRWLQKEDDGIIKVNRIYQRGPYATRPKQAAHKALNMLLEHGYVRPKGDGTEWEIRKTF